MAKSAAPTTFKSDRKLLEAKVRADLNLPSNAEAERIVKAVFGSLNSILRDNAKKGGYILRIVEIGTFKVASKKASKRRNPRTGESFTVPAHKKLTFRFAKDLRPAKATKASE